MRTEVINGHKVKFYETIDETPIKNYHLMNKYLMIDSDIGSNMSDVDRHMKDSLLFLEAGDIEKAKEELLNLRQLFWLVMEEKNVTHLSFVCIIHSIDGEIIEDLSERNLRDVLKTLDKQADNNDTK